MSDNIKLSGLRFQHYKNKKFYNHIWDAKWLGSVVRPFEKFAFEAKHTETGDTIKVYRNNHGKYKYLSDKNLGELTIYQTDYDDPTHGYGMIWARPTDMFWDSVEDEEGNIVSRFQLVVN